jgi:hypothetical protein
MKRVLIIILLSACQKSEYVDTRVYPDMSTLHRYVDVDEKVETTEYHWFTTEAGDTIDEYTQTRMAWCGARGGGYCPPALHNGVIAEHYWRWEAESCRKYCTVHNVIH